MSDLSPNSEPTPHDPPPEPPAISAEALFEAVRLAEALVFAAAAPVTARTLANALPVGIDPDAVVTVLRERYAGRGVELAEVAGGLQFRTAADLAMRLRRVVQVPRRLPRVAMETLAIIAYHQPITRAEIEEIRGASLSQQTLDSLLELGLVAPKGRKESPGRPTLWATTIAFLAQFGLKDLRDLPRREDLLVEPPSPHPAGEAPQPEAQAAADPAAEPAPESPAESAAHPDEA